MTTVSIVMPTYNRADTIKRAIDSVMAQTFQDWELLIVNDGSTDATEDVLQAASDPRIKVFRQANRGFTEARNAGIRMAHGEYLAFLDSDDEYLPHHLELTIAYLQAHPQAMYVGTEVLEDFGHGRRVNHYRTEVSDWYPRKAALINARDFDRKPGYDDDYMRVYTARASLGGWAVNVPESITGAPGSFVYQGDIFAYWRYDFLMTITATVMRRTVVDVIGMPDPSWQMGSDFHFEATLCRHWITHFISVPTFVKHEYAPDGTLPSLGHVVTGKTSVRFAQQWQRAWDDLFVKGKIVDDQTAALRAVRLLWNAETGIRAGDRYFALQSLREARSAFPYSWHLFAVLLVVRTSPSMRFAWRLTRLGMRAAGLLAHLAFWRHGMRGSTGRVLQ
jgi:glycosyltransferase involved in cell wall biosynthesis